MKRSLLFFVFLGIVQTACAQQLFPLASTLDSLRIAVGASDHHISLELKEPVVNLNHRNSTVSFTKIYLSDADIVVSYIPGKQPPGFDQRIELWLKDSAGTIIYPDPFSVKMNATETGERQITWMDATETSLVFGYQYQLYLKVSLLGPVDCTTKRPDFILQEQLPYYAVGIAALATIGIGQGVNIQKKNAYRHYQDLWATGNTASEAQPDLTLAQKKESRATTLIYSGVAILGIDALLWSIRAIKTKRQQRLYDRFCIQPIGIGCAPIQKPRPFHSIDTTAPTFGIQLTYRF